MARLIYASNMSLDGCTEDERGGFDWAPPDDDVFAFITDLMRSAGTYLYGRRMYETMAVWETDATLAAESALMAEFAQVWQVLHLRELLQLVHVQVVTDQVERGEPVVHVPPGADEVAGLVAVGLLRPGGPEAVHLGPRHARLRDASPMAHQQRGVGDDVAG